MIGIYSAVPPQLIWPYSYLVWPLLYKREVENECTTLWKWNLDDTLQMQRASKLNNRWRFKPTRRLQRWGWSICHKKRDLANGKTHFKIEKKLTSSLLRDKIAASIPSSRVRSCQHFNQFLPILLTDTLCIVNLCIDRNTQVNTVYFSLNLQQVITQ